jgi:hypothetical protein
MLRYRQSSDMETGGRVGFSCFRVSVFIISEVWRHLVKMAISFSRYCTGINLRPRS